MTPGHPFWSAQSQNAAVTALGIGAPPANPRLSAHRTSKVWEFLERNRNVRIHYTPTYSSWLNQVEIWFSKIQRDVIARGIFASVKDLDRKLIRYIRSYNKKPKPFKWTYADTERRIRTTKKSM